MAGKELPATTYELAGFHRQSRQQTACCSPGVARSADGCWQLDTRIGCLCRWRKRLWRGWATFTLATLGRVAGGRPRCSGSSALWFYALTYDDWSTTFAATSRPAVTEC